MGIVQTAMAALKVVNQAGDLIKSDKELSNDLQTFLTEVGGQLKTAEAHPAANASLKEAFNNVAGLLPVGQQFAREGKLPVAPLIGIFTQRAKYEKSIDTLGKAFEANNPAVTGLVESIIASKSLKRLADKTNGTVFSVQDGPNGTGIVNINEKFCIPGILPSRLFLCKRDHDELKAFLKADGGPTPPKGAAGPRL